MSDEDQATSQPSTNLDLGPLPKLGLDIEHFPQELATTQKVGEGMISHKSPWQKSTKCGLSGGTSGPHTQLVVGASANPRDKLLPGACPEDKGLF